MLHQIQKWVLTVHDAPTSTNADNNPKCVHKKTVIQHQVTDSAALQHKKTIMMQQKKKATIIVQPEAEGNMLHQQHNKRKQHIMHTGCATPAPRAADSIVEAFLLRTGRSTQVHLQKNNSDKITAVPR